MDGRTRSEPACGLATNEQEPSTSTHMKKRSQRAALFGNCLRLISLRML